MSTEDKKRPHRTTMEGMIWNANHVLDRALDPNISGVPRIIFEMCRGVVLISVVEVGFIFSGSGGTGVVISKNEDGSWSPPSAIGLGGIGFGFFFGADIKDILIVFHEESPMKSIANHGQVKLGGEIGLAVGPVGREVESQLNASPKGGGVSFAYAFSKGAFLGVGLEGAVLKSRNKENARFYGKEATASQILFEEGAVEIPENTMIPELHKKLAMLEAGKTMTLTMSEEAKKESMRVHAEEAGEAAKEEQDDVVEVNAEEEAAKEEAAKEEAAKEDAAEEEPPKEEAATEDVAEEESPKEEAATEEAAKEESPKEETAKEEAAKEESPKEEVTKEAAAKEEAAPAEPDAPKTAETEAVKE